MIAHFTAVKPKTYAEFYHIAQTAEANFKRFDSSKAFDNTVKPMQRNNAKQTAIKSEKAKPPSPCRICENLGFKNRFHWASDCFNKNKSQNAGKQIPKQVNVVEDNDGLNEINSINLN
ncbi:hypothetical protein B4U80_01880 [Leptotrombidium deliense]|uniref:Uncharacterized protein n=1 Tax=Leptotrombidium deliense TaxID=299467 RepID=A0A443S995_9ACAR|nr:hypothetical protein B4U80_01880 [Leptotrombidium deliense]